MGGAFENNAVCGEEEGSLCWQDVWAPQEAPCGLLPTVGVQKHPQPLWHQLLPGKQSWTQNLRLTGKEKNNTWHSRTDAQTVPVYEHCQ